MKTIKNRIIDELVFLNIQENIEEYSISGLKLKNKYADIVSRRTHEVIDELCEMS